MSLARAREVLGDDMFEEALYSFANCSNRGIALRAEIALRKMFPSKRPLRRAPHEPNLVDERDGREI
jgi:hypothetical protein